MRPQGHSGWVLRNWYDHALALIKTFSESRNRRTLDKRVIVQFSDNLPLDLLLFFVFGLFVCFFQIKGTQNNPLERLAIIDPRVQSMFRLDWFGLG